MPPTVKQKNGHRMFLMPSMPRPRDVHAMAANGCSLGSRRCLRVSRAVGSPSRRRLRERRRRSSFYHAPRRLAASDTGRQQGDARRGDWACASDGCRRRAGRRSHFGKIPIGCRPTGAAMTCRDADAAARRYCRRDKQALHAFSIFDGQRNARAGDYLKKAEADYYRYRVKVYSRYSSLQAADWRDVVLSFTKLGLGPIFGCFSQ